MKEKIIEIIGSDNVSDDCDLLETYSGDQSFVSPIKPKMVVKPGNEDEVQKIVNLSNQSGTPLIPVSSGTPHFRGDTVPGVGGTIVIDLSRMNQILRIDKRNKMTIIEPGVTFKQLIPELAKNNLRIPTPLLPRTTKSVIGSLLEREPIMTPRYQWHMPDPLRCLNVVWGSGDILRTGDAGGHGSLEEQWKMNLAQVCGLGPTQTDYHRLLLAAQGTMGIVTWASVRCELLPELQKLLILESETLESLIDFTYKILKFRYGDEILLFNKSYLAYIFGDTLEDINKLKQELPNWILLIGISGYGPYSEERLAFQEQDITDIAQQFDLKISRKIAGLEEGQMLESLKQTSSEPYWKLKYKGRCQDIFFLTTLNRTPEFVTLMNENAEAGTYSTADIGVYLQPMMQGVACHCEFSLPFDHSKYGELNKIAYLFQQSSERLLQAGAFFSRPYGSWADLAFNRDAQQTIALKKIKSIFDPNNIMNPGKLCF